MQATQLPRSPDSYCLQKLDPLPLLIGNEISENIFKYLLFYFKNAFGNNKLHFIYTIPIQVAFYVHIYVCLCIHV